MTERKKTEKNEELLGPLGQEKKSNSLIRVQEREQSGHGWKNS